MNDDGRHEGFAREAADAYALLRGQVERHPYGALAAATGLGLVLGGAGLTRWVAAAAAFALREGARWAAREGLRHIVEAPPPAAVRRDRASTSTSTSTSGQRSHPH